MDSIEALAQYFREFPGIGPRQAKRFAYYVVAKGGRYAQALAEAINDASTRVSTCSMCYRFYTKPTVEGATPVCDTCRDPLRDHSQLLIVSKDADMDAIKRSGAYQGMFFVLGGTVPMLDANPSHHVRLRELEKRIKDETGPDGMLTEVILSLDATTEGDHTEDVLRTTLTPLLIEKAIPLRHLGRGLSTGSELEYADSQTIISALKNRQ
jgi:recombination protein RecR